MPDQTSGHSYQVSGYIRVFTSYTSDHIVASMLFFSSPEPKAHGELIVYQSSRRPSVHPSVRPSVRPHFQTLISPQPASQLQPNFI